MQVMCDVNRNIYADGIPAIHPNVDPAIVHIARDAPHMSTNAACPQMKTLIAPFAQRIEKVAPRITQRLTHVRVPFDGDSLVEQWRVTVIVFEEVDAPRSLEMRVLFFKAETAWIARTGLPALSFRWGISQGLG